MGKNLRTVKTLVG